MSRRCSSPALSRVQRLAEVLDGQGGVLSGPEAARMIRAAMDGQDPQSAPGVLVDDVPLPVLLAAVDNCLRQGSYMTGGNLAFSLLCEQLGVERDALAFDPAWVRPGDADWPPAMAERTARPAPR